jgi:hypothetical protein
MENMRLTVSVLFLFSRTIPRTESVLVMTSTIIFLSCTALATMLGRSGVAILHGIASESFSRSANGEPNWFSRVYGKDQLLTDCESGRFTRLLRLSSEILGIVAVAPLYCWSTSQERPAPFDASCAFTVASLVTFVLYVSSFALHLNVAGEFAPHPRESGCGAETDARRSFVCEVFSVSVGDMASLFEEANWSSCPLISFSRGQGKERGLDRSVHRLSTKSV